jgi:hypothetical protein
MNPSQKNLTKTERETIATWADKQLAQKIAKGELINNPERWIAWRIGELEAQALQDASTRRQLARYADAWGLQRTNSGAYAPPIEDVPHPVATPAEVERWKALNHVVWRLPVDHWIRVHALERLMEPRRPDDDRTEEDEIRADAEAKLVLAELEALIHQHADEIKPLLGHAKPILKAMP